MKKLNVDFSNGSHSLIETTIPSIDDNQILVKTQYSAVSIGTELNTLKFAKNNLLKKGAVRKDILLKVFKKFKEDGLFNTINLIKNKLSKVISMGYSSSGIIVRLGKNISDLKLGDHVACYGQEYASHSEYIKTYPNLVSKVKKKYLKESSFGMIGAICLNSIRISNIYYGQKVLIIGAGLLGSILAKILTAYGHDITIVDIDLSKKKNFNRNENISFYTYSTFKQNEGDFDICFITASNESSKPLNFAIENLKFNSEIIILGITQISLDRNVGWEKQISIKVSKAGGAGSLDRKYETSLNDFPSYIKDFTLKNNVSEFIRLIEMNRVDISHLTKKTYDFNDAENIFTEFINKPVSYENILFKYKLNPKKKNEILRLNNFDNNKLSLSVLGTGNFSKSVVLPKLNKIKNLDFNYLYSDNNNETVQLGKKYKFNYITSNLTHILKTSSKDFLIAPIKNSLHFKIIENACEKKKRLLIEKPICINRSELEIIRNKYYYQRDIFIGHNRRYSKHIEFIKNELNESKVTKIKIEVYPGLVEKNHWVYSIKQGGNRSINEITHYLDLIFIYVDRPVFKIKEINSLSNQNEHRLDNLEINLKTNKNIIIQIKYLPNKINKYREILHLQTADNFEYIIKDFKKTIKMKENKIIKSFRTSKQDLGYEKMYKLFFDRSYQDDNFQRSIESMALYFDLINNV